MQFLKLCLRHIFHLSVGQQNIPVRAVQPYKISLPASVRMTVPANNVGGVWLAKKPIPICNLVISRPCRFVPGQRAPERRLAVNNWRQSYQSRRHLACVTASVGLYCQPDLFQVHFAHRESRIVLHVADALAGQDEHCENNYRDTPQCNLCRKGERPCLHFLLSMPIMTPP